MKFTTSPKELLAAITAKLADKGEGNYFVYVEHFGIIRARKTSQISWQWFGIGIPRRELQKKLDTLPPLAIDIELEGAEYTTDLLADKLLGNIPTSNKVDDDETPESEEQTEAGATHLKAIYKFKEVKKALKAIGVKKKAAKKILDATNWEDDTASGFDIMDGFDVANGAAATEKEANEIFGALTK